MSRSEKSALLIGNSDGIGLRLTQQLSDLGWHCTGISRSPSRLKIDDYEHHVCDIGTPEFPGLLQEVQQSNGAFGLVIFLAGTGHEFNVEELAQDQYVVEVNFLALLKTVEVVLPQMIESKCGQIIALSSIADALLLPEAISYSASKAGMSSYLHALALAVRKHRVAVTNIRFGFVDTKMADAPIKPMMISVDRATAKILSCIGKRKIQVTYPRTIGILARFLQLLIKIRISICR